MQSATQIKPAGASIKSARSRKGLPITSFTTHKVDQLALAKHGWKAPPPPTPRRDSLRGTFAAVGALDGAVNYCRRRPGVRRLLVGLLLHGRQLRGGRVLAAGGHQRLCAVSGPLSGEKETRFFLKK